MKIAVATIAKNEEQFVQRWAESCKEADYRLILDTGSTDGTIYKATANNIECFKQVFTPWRFDHARNHAMSLIPEDIDYVIWLDMDEQLQPGWREALETATCTRPRYKYIWSWNEDGTEGLVYGGDKIHSRHGYTWKHPVHEVLHPEATETQQWIDGLEIHHHPDNTKSRGQYFDLLKLAVEEDPRDDRNQFYLAREYFFNNEYGMAQYHFARHLDLSLWNPERAASHRYIAKMRPDAAEHHLYKAIAEDPNRREAWVDLAMVYYNRQDWISCRMASAMALRITEKPMDYLCEADAWGWLPHDLMAISCYNQGDVDEAWYHGSLAASMNPTDERLKANLTHYRV
jgi:glycosyltransferase involved in cell wall biosynthesis